MLLLLAVDEVETALAPATSTEAEDDHLTVTDLGTLLQASPNSIYKFIARGLIEIGTIRNAVTNIPQRAIAPEVAGAFQKRYVSLAECCRRSRLHSSAVKRICRAARWH